MKTSVEALTPAQHRLLDSLGLDIVGCWTVVRGSLPMLGGEAAAFGIEQLFDRLEVTASSGAP